MEAEPTEFKCPTRGRACVAAAAQIMSAKWTAQLIYALANGVCRFSELQREVGGVNPRTLSARLDELAAAGIIAKQAIMNQSAHVEYSLTEKGRDLLPILDQMVAWGNKYAPSEALQD